MNFQKSLTAVQYNS